MSGSFAGSQLQDQFGLILVETETESPKYLICHLPAGNQSQPGSKVKALTKSADGRYEEGEATLVARKNTFKHVQLLKTMLEEDTLAPPPQVDHTALNCELREKLLISNNTGPSATEKKSSEGLKENDGGAGAQNVALPSGRVGMDQRAHTRNCPNRKKSVAAGARKKDAGTSSGSKDKDPIEIPPSQEQEQTSVARMHHTPYGIPNRTSSSSAHEKDAGTSCGTKNPSPIQASPSQERHRTDKEPLSREPASKKAYDEIITLDDLDTQDSTRPEATLSYSSSDSVSTDVVANDTANSIEEITIDDDDDCVVSSEDVILDEESTQLDRLETRNTTADSSPEGTRIVMVASRYNSLMSSEKDVVVVEHSEPAKLENKHPSATSSRESLRTVVAPSRNDREMRPNPFVNFSPMVPSEITVPEIKVEEFVWPETGQICYFVHVPTLVNKVYLFKQDDFLSCGVPRYVCHFCSNMEEERPEKPIKIYLFNKSVGKFGPNPLRFHYEDCRPMSIEMAQNVLRRNARKLRGGIRPTN